MDAHIYSLGVRVLIYQEDGEFCAQALELDLLGYGKTEGEAVSELLKMIQCQLAFARFKNDDNLLPFPAPKQCYDKWQAAHAAALKNEISQEKAEAMEIKAAWVTIGNKSTKASKARFKAVDLACA